MCDAQWLQQLQSAGMLRGSFRTARAANDVVLVAHHKGQVQAPVEFGLEAGVDRSKEAQDYDAGTSVEELEAFADHDIIA